MAKVEGVLVFGVVCPASRCSGSRPRDTVAALAHAAREEGRRDLRFTHGCSGDSRLREEESGRAGGEERCREALMGGQDRTGQDRRSRQWVGS